MTSKTVHTRGIGEKRNEDKYEEYKKPRWSPPAWLFGPVWSVLYILIAVSYGYVGFLFAQGKVPGIVVVPFILNLIFNFSYTYIQFRLRNFSLALIDILLVDVSLVWALIAIYPFVPWVLYINIPYGAWVSFATVLQISITLLNKRKSG
jgi:benzodiazapine receptor